MFSKYIRIIISVHNYFSKNSNRLNIYYIAYFDNHVHLGCFVLFYIALNVASSTEYESL